MSSASGEAVRRSAAERLLIVFTRYPEPGVAKTRLIPAIGPTGAARVQRAMTERTLARVAAAPHSERSWDTLVRFAGADTELMRRWLGSAHRCLPQGPGDLGERLRAAFTEGFAGGVSSIAVIGTDCPDLGAADIEAAFDSLAARDAVFGPAHDGGYWLVGLRRDAFQAAAEPLFAGIGWGGGAVCADSRAAALRAGLSVDCLRTLADVDRPEDLAAWDRVLRADASGETITVVVPALDEAARIGALVEQLRGADGVDVVVSDGGSVDGTPAAALASGARVVTGRRGRAVQMNAGARTADGGILLFLHADTRLPQEWDAAVRDLLRESTVVGGCFTFATDSPHLRLKVIEAVANWRGRRLGIFFGDQAIFVRRAVFESLGGFAEVPLMEDYEFVRRLRRQGRVVILPQQAVTSARRWDSRGPWRNSLKNAAITAAYLAGVSPERLAAWYRGGRS